MQADVVGQPDEVPVVRDGVPAKSGQPDQRGGDVGQRARHDDAPLRGRGRGYGHGDDGHDRRHAEVTASARQSSGGPSGVPPQRRAAAPSTTSRKVPTTTSSAATRYRSSRLSDWNSGPSPGRPPDRGHAAQRVAEGQHVGDTRPPRAAQTLTRFRAVPRRSLRRTAVARRGPPPGRPRAGPRRPATRTGSGRSAHPGGHVARRPVGDDPARDCPGVLGQHDLAVLGGEPPLQPLVDMRRLAGSATVAAATIGLRDHRGVARRAGDVDVEQVEVGRDGRCAPGSSARTH